MKTLNAFFAFAVTTAATFADVHHFSYATETGTLPAGSTEVEVWNTVRIGRDAYYYGLDQRLEFEVGITDRLQGALYLNWNRTTEADTSGVVGTASDFEGFSAELKYKVSDAGADAVGFGLYGELGFNTDETEIEGKLLFDKNLGPWIFAANLIVEGEIENREFELEEIEVQPVLAVAYEITPAFTLGLELRNHNEIEKESEEFEWMNSALYLGPAIAYSGKSFALSLSILPQLPALKTEGGETYETHDHEKLEARLRLSVNF